MPTCTIRGRLKRFRYQKPGWGIAEVEARDASALPQDGSQHKAGLFVAVGNIEAIAPGEEAEFAGEWMVHPSYGHQFKVASAMPTTPRDEAGVIGFLEHLPEIGPNRARAIVAKFGAEQIWAVLERTPEALLGIPGITVDRLQSIRVAYDELACKRETIVLLKTVHLTDWQIAKVQEWAGTQAKHQGAETRTPNHGARFALVREALEKNPYAWTEIRGFGFVTVDGIALASGIGRNAPQRVRAAIEYVLDEAREAGHCFLPRRELEVMLDELARVRGEGVGEAVQALIDLGRIVQEDDRIALPWLRACEVRVADRLHGRRVAQAEFESTHASASFRSSGTPVITYNAEQSRAIAASLNPLVTALVITGGPGVGKTECTRAIVERFDGRVGLCSPTGKAAKRLSEASGREAETIHRLLGVEPGGGFIHNAENQLPHDMILVDEASMVDIELMDALLDATSSSTKLVLVGDVDQLPSIGPGHVLRDVIASRMIPTVRLEHVYRQGERSYISVNAQRMRRGEDLMLDPNAEDFFWLPCNDAKAAFDQTIKLVTDVIPQRHGVDPVRDVQVLAPQRKGDCGIFAFNAALQPLLNPPKGMKPMEARNPRGMVFREGDKVRHIRNNYALQVFNGEVGIVTTIEEHVAGATRTTSVAVDYGDRVVTYPSQRELDEIVLHYAGTVHASQGSEYPVVVLLLHSSHSYLLSRNLAYTGLTRAKKAVYLVGDEKGLKRALKNTDVAQRHTRLAERIRGT
jgi:exodeoxyribonuclease V alpha subunit